MQLLFLLSILINVIFCPVLARQQRAGYIDYGIYAHMQIPFIIIVLMGTCWWLYRKKSKVLRYLILVPIVYALATFTTNIIGEKYLQVDHSEDLPIGTWLKEYTHKSALVKSQIVGVLGSPLTSQILSKTSSNVPRKVMAGVKYAPEGSEVMVYEETDRIGRHFTYFIFINPKTERWIFYHDIAGELREDQWPNQPLR
jgi:hypothetical protein